MNPKVQRVLNLLAAIDAKKPLPPPEAVLEGEPAPEPAPPDLLPPDSTGIRYKTRVESPCGKASFTSQSAANTEIRHILRYKKTPNNGHLISYHCPDCGLWHFTSRKASPSTLRQRKHRK